MSEPLIGPRGGLSRAFVSGNVAATRAHARGAQAVALEGRREGEWAVSVGRTLSV